MDFTSSQERQYLHGEHVTPALVFAVKQQILQAVCHRLDSPRFWKCIVEGKESDKISQVMSQEIYLSPALGFFLPRLRDVRKTSPVDAKIDPPTGGTLHFFDQVISSCSTLSQTWQKFSISRCPKSKNAGVPLPSSMTRGSKIG